MSDGAGIGDGKILAGWEIFDGAGKLTSSHRRSRHPVFFMDTLLFQCIYSFYVLLGTSTRI